jgi:hypothetical protein
MERITSNSERSFQGRKRHWIALTLITSFVLTTGISGCSLGVMAGKMLMGDPKQKAPFRAATGKDLTKGKDSVLIICTAPYRILSEFPSLQIDVLDRVTRILETREVKVISSDKVASWFDDHGEWGDFASLAKEFDADYLMSIDIEKFTHRVPDSDHLMQGAAEGRVNVYSVGGKESLGLREVFEKSFQLSFPTSYPVPRENRSERIFIEGFLDRLSLQLAQHMYDHKLSETVH